MADQLGLHSSTLAHQHPPDIDLLILVNYWNYYSNEQELIDAILAFKQY
jgi:hypothetical protein